MINAENEVLGNARILNEHGIVIKDAIMPSESEYIYRFVIVLYLGHILIMICFIKYILALNEDQLYHLIYNAILTISMTNNESS